MTAKSRLRKMKRPELVTEGLALGIIVHNPSLYGTVALREAIEETWTKLNINRPGVYVAN